MTKYANVFFENTHKIVINGNNKGRKVIIMNFLEIFLELLVGYISIFIVVKFLGKTQINQITPFDFISALVLGNFIGETIFNDKLEIVNLVFAIVTWGIMIYFTELLTQKSMKARQLFEGKPSMLIREGKIIWKELKSNHVDLNQLLQLLRVQGIFSIQDVEYALLESSGNLSVMKKSYLEIPTYEDLKIHREKATFPILLIMDGEVIQENLIECGLNKEWMIGELKKQKVEHIKDICFAEWKLGGELYIQKYV